MFGERWQNSYEKAIIIVTLVFKKTHCSLGFLGLPGCSRIEVIPSKPYAVYTMGTAEILI